jgi:beta-glucosidase/6-phospho-beta-glucosidase/beta-galactosidase
MINKLTPKFKSFFMAGFECTYALAENKRRFDLLAASRHDEMVENDYEMIKQVGIKTVREGLSWSQIDRGKGVYDFSRFEPMMRAAKEIGIQQIWDLNHFDYPGDVNAFSPEFPKRFAEYAKHCAEIIRKYQTGTLYISPLNEPSFFAWMCDVGKWAPYATGKGDEFKKQIVRATLASMDAIWSVDKNVQFLHCDPYMYRQPQRLRSQQDKEFCENFNQKVKYHSWDMICGKANPELGGSPKYMNFLGMNYYFYNQQQVKIEDRNGKQIVNYQSVPLNSERRLPLAEIIKEIYARYKTPVIIAETGSRGQLRNTWWPYMLKQVEDCKKQNLPLHGVCSYPTLDIIRGAGFIFPRSGLWDFKPGDKTCQRVPHNKSLTVIKKFKKFSR